MVKFNTIGAIEHKYAFKDAVLKADALNGDFGAITDGMFDVAANATSAIMQVEVGDDMGLPEYKINAGEHVRVVNLKAFDGETIEVYGAQLPDEFAVGDKLVSNAAGKLATGGSVAPYLEVTKIIGNKLGVEATVVATAVAAE